MLKPWLSGNGYLYVSLAQGGKYIKRSIHLLVAESFLPPRPETAEVVNHLDGDPSNNAVWNLHWATRKENARHAEMEGLWDRWKHVPRAFDPLDVVQICRDAKGGKRVGAIAEERGVHRTTIRDIVLGRRYVDVDRETGEVSPPF